MLMIDVGVSQVVQLLVQFAAEFNRHDLVLGAVNDVRRRIPKISKNGNSTSSMPPLAIGAMPANIGAWCIPISQVPMPPFDIPVRKIRSGSMWYRR